MLLYPGAYADIRVNLQAISNFSALKIVCAGIWHNFVLALIAWLLIHSGPLLSIPFYRNPNGVLVTYVHDVCLRSSY